MRTWESVVHEWRSRLETDHPHRTPETREAVLCWLLTEQGAEFDGLEEEHQQVLEQSMEFCYNILCQRYLGVSPEAAYRHLIRRLGSLVLLRNKIRTWVSLSRDRRRTVVDVVQEVLQEMLNSDRYLQGEMRRITRCGGDRHLQNALVLASLEEYCLRPIRNQPLLVYRFVNYLRRSQRGGLTQVPSQELVRLVSVEIAPNHAPDTVNLLDAQTLEHYESDRAWEEQQTLRDLVAREFTQYLQDHVSPLAAQWLGLYLQGYSQEAIAEQLQVPIKQLYRLREKVGYHAIRVFSLKHSPDLVANWLKTSLQDHQLGLTSSEWQHYYNSLEPHQQEILDRFKAGESVESIAHRLQIKTTQVTSEWGKLYLAAQQIRNSTE